MPGRGGSGDLLAGRGQRAAEAPVGRPAGEERSATADRRRGRGPPPPRPPPLPRVLARTAGHDGEPQLRGVQTSPGRPPARDRQTPSLTLPAKGRDKFTASLERPDSLRPCELFLPDDSHRHSAEGGR